ncbi:FMN-binding protein [Hoylesella shahii]
MAKLKVDGVSGATFSSKAIIGNVQRGVQYVANNPLK